MEIAILRWLTDFCQICAPLNKTAFAIISKIYTNKCRIIKKIINGRKQKIDKKGRLEQQELKKLI
jgi:hypothetical protein